jgi:hypothetical protein
MTRAHQPKRKKRKDKSKRARRNRMSGSKGNGNDSGGLVVKPDGMSSDAEQITVKIYETEFPMPSDKIVDIRKLCMRTVNIKHPLTGVEIPTQTLAMTADTALLVLELHYALKDRDKRLEVLEERIRRLEDPTERAVEEGYDGLG